MTLSLHEYIDLPSHQQGGFDHADVHISSGRVYVAHTATGSVEVLDCDQSRHLTSIPGCPEASGVVCAQEENLVFAAARGSGDILVIDARVNRVLKTLRVGLKPNGIAWDSQRQQLLAADVGDNLVRLIDHGSEKIVASHKLPGKPSWCIYSEESDLFLVNIREPSGLLSLTPQSLKVKSFTSISAAGAHGVDLDDENHRAFIACDDGVVVILDLKSGREEAVVPIGGMPDVVWYNHVRHRLYCAIGRLGLIDVIDTDELVVDERIVTEEGTHTFTFDQKRQKLYAFLPRSCRAAVYKEA